MSAEVSTGPSPSSQAVIDILVRQRNEALNRAVLLEAELIEARRALARHPPAWRDQAQSRPGRRDG